MRALILVGGYGTRLRPLTFTKPKPLVPFANVPIVLHQIEALARVGVTEIVLAVSYQSKQLEEALLAEQEKLGIRIIISKEDVPLGTAGPLALARQLLGADDEPFFVFNSDVSCSYPLEELLTFHKNHGKEGTIFVTKVKDPSKYGVVVFDEETGQIDSFVEKPKEFVGDKINAGLYIFNPSILDRIKPIPTSIERVIFPQMSNEGELFALELPGFWMDIGQPKDYVAGTSLFLHHLRNTQPDRLADDEKEGGIVGNVLIGENVSIGSNSVIGPDVVLGPNVVIGEGARLQNCVIFEGSNIGNNAFVRKSIIGWNCTLSPWSRIQDLTVLGENVKIKDSAFLSGVIVLPHKSVRSDELASRIIM